jgi:hypothetical protein
MNTKIVRMFWLKTEFERMLGYANKNIKQK